MVLTETLNPELKLPEQPYKNFIYPVTFIKNNNGYILLKKSDGTNVFYRVIRDNDKWKVIELKSKVGKKMDNKLLWYM